MGTEAFFPNGTQFKRSRGYGSSSFINYERLQSREFIKGNDVYIVLTVEGMSIKIVSSKLFFCGHYLLIYLLFIYLFLGLYQQHMEVPRLGVESEL